MRRNISIDDVLAGKVDEYCERERYGFSELISELLRHRMMGVDIQPAATHVLHKEEGPPLKKDTLPIVPIPEVPQDAQNPAVPEEKVYDELWEDSNWMPVKKERLPERFCATFHKKGETRTVYEITRLTGDNKVVYKKLLCKECVVAELTDIKARGEGRLE